MRMTQAQAIAYCHHQAMSALHGSPIVNQRSILWTQLRNELERGGLDIVENACTTWRDEHIDGTSPTGNTTWTLYGTFLDALYDDEEIERAIAHELLWKVKEEIDRREEWPLRTHYLSCLRNHLSNVLNGSTRLGAYEEVREGIELHLHTLEEEYGKWIDEALKNQE